MFGLTVNLHKASSLFWLVMVFACLVYGVINAHRSNKTKEAAIRVFQERAAWDGMFGAGISACVYLAFYADFFKL